MKKFWQKKAVTLSCMLFALAFVLFGVSLSFYPSLRVRAADDSYPGCILVHYNGVNQLFVMDSATGLTPVSNYINALNTTDDEPVLVKLLGDWLPDDSLALQGHWYLELNHSVVFDLNGYIFKYWRGDKLFELTSNDIHLTITDSSSGKTGQLQGGAPMIHIKNISNVKITLAGGSLYSSFDLLQGDLGVDLLEITGGNWYDHRIRGGVHLSENGVMKMTGGKIWLGGDSPGSAFFNKHNAMTLKIDGGEVWFDAELPANWPNVTWEVGENMMAVHTDENDDTSPIVGYIVDPNAVIPGEEETPEPAPGQDNEANVNETNADDAAIINNLLAQKRIFPIVAGSAAGGMFVGAVSVAIIAAKKRRRHRFA